jgi:hypothetical protein
VKITQYCSVCREELEMEVVPTDDGEDDGVIWLRCPRCRGFLPKMTGVGESEAGGGKSAASDKAPASTASPQVEKKQAVEDREISAPAPPAGPARERPSRAGRARSSSKEEPARIPPEYETMLAEMDCSRALPYRPWESYGVGDVIHHLAWDDCGVVVAKETLPGNRHVVVVYFEKGGLVRLIEEAERQP